MPRHLICMLLACIAGAAPAQTKPPTIRPGEIRATVAFLADDLLDGRKPGTPGYDIAAHYVASRFEAMGLKPGVDGSWYQTIRFRTIAIDPAKPAAITVGGSRFDNGVSVAMAPDGRFPDQSLEARAVFVGYGLDARKQGYDDYRGLNVRGKFVVVLSGVPEGAPQDVAALSGRDKARIAMDHGAIGVLTVLTPKTLKSFSWQNAVRAMASSRREILEPDGQPLLKAPGIRATAYIAQPAFDSLLAGSGLTANDIFAVAATPGGRLKGRALKPRVHFAASTSAKTMESPNVIGVLPGTDPELSKEYVLLTAHLDHLGDDAEAEGPDKIFNGAMDNAAGVATMLAAAEAFVDSGVAPKRSVMFAALTSEETGLLGSAYLARNPVVPAGARVIADVNLDMPILLYKLDDVVAFGAEHSTIGQTVARAAAKIGLTVSPDFMPEENIFTRSDHYSFVKQGVPSIMLATGVKNGGKEAFQAFLAKTYHSPRDQIDLPFNWDAAVKFAQVNYEIARDLADAPEAPRWYGDSPYAAKFAKGQPTASRPAD
ncbi:M28 family metallopeptidase [Sphingomonas sp. CLY1604]|uniref:M28 family metallopeptidase n=1 Tax=Sphingomonas sp. CLY1604 TaxID=3457786 RepID=UPI003FD83588